MKNLTKYLFGIFITASLIYAEANDIVKGVPFVEIESYGTIYTIKRDQNPNSKLTNTYARTSRPSPPFFIQPFSVTKNIETYGELEVLSFLNQKKGVFIDARLTNWYKKSAIPGAINIPFKLFLTNTEKRRRVLIKLGAFYRNSQWNFTYAKTLLFYCNGAWCGQSPTAIRALIKIGYPENKMKYYRGGMQTWQLLGLTTIVPRAEQ